MPFFNFRHSTTGKQFIRPGVAIAAARSSRSQRSEFVFKVRRRRPDFEIRFRQPDFDVRLRQPDLDVRRQLLVRGGAEGDHQLRPTTKEERSKSGRRRRRGAPCSSRRSRFQFDGGRNEDCSVVSFEHRLFSWHRRISFFKERAWRARSAGRKAEVV